MEPGGSMPHSQRPYNNLYPELNEPNSPYFFKIHSNIVSHLRLGLPKGLLPSGVLVKIFKAVEIFCPSQCSRFNHPDYIR